MRIAALDLGSNTSLLLVAEVEGGRVVKVVHDETTITRLGQGVHAQRRFHPEALARMDSCLKQYSEKAKQLGAEQVVAVATSAARDVSNGQELLAIGKRYGIPIRIISGAHEARLTYLGALCDRSSTDGIAVVDVGGGSTEIITVAGDQVVGSSVDVGSVRLSELFVHHDPILPGEQEQLRTYTEKAFAAAKLPPPPRELVAVAGTPTTLAGLDQQIDFTENKIHGYKMSLARVEEWIARMAKLNLEQRSALLGMQPKRADVILAGSTILATAIRTLHKSEITISTRGVRYGVALEWAQF